MFLIVLIFLALENKSKVSPNDSSENYYSSSPSSSGSSSQVDSEFSTNKKQRLSPSLPKNNLLQIEPNFGASKRLFSNFSEQQENIEKKLPTAYPKITSSNTTTISPIVSPVEQNTSFNYTENLQHKYNQFLSSQFQNQLPNQAFINHQYLNQSSFYLPALQSQQKLIPNQTFLPNHEQAALAAAAFHLNSNLAAAVAAASSSQSNSYNRIPPHLMPIGNQFNSFPYFAQFGNKFSPTNKTEPENTYEQNQSYFESPNNMSTSSVTSSTSSISNESLSVKTNFSKSKSSLSPVSCKTSSPRVGSDI